MINRLVFGVGSRLATSDGSPSLDGVYKLVALKRDGAWQPAIKRSDTPEKVLNPGTKRLWRVTDQQGMATADVLSTADEALLPGAAMALHHHSRADVSRVIRAEEWAGADELLQRVIADGEVVSDGGMEALKDGGILQDNVSVMLNDLGVISERRRADVAALGPGVRRLVNPHTYHVSITESLWDLKQELLAKLG